MKDTISTRSTVQAAHQEHVSCSVAGEAVILQLQEGAYYGLDPVGSRIWDLLQQPRGVSELQEILLAEYEVEPEQCERDLLALLKQLDAAGLITVRQ